MSAGAHPAGAAAPPAFTRYEMFVVGVLAFLQFTIILDFMTLSPLGAFLIRDLHVTTKQFGLLVSAYAFSAGISGIITAGFADSFDRKKMLLVFYIGFILGTLLCGLVSTVTMLLIARIVTGIFGGVLGGISMAIITDLFAPQMRGRVMGVVQTAFAVSQVAGLPLGLYLANLWDWHAPFLMIAGLGTVAGVAIFVGLKPIDAHLKVSKPHSAYEHLLKTCSNRVYQQGFAATVLMATGGFMLMPFGSAFTVNNLGISIKQLPIIYLITGISAMFTGPLIGRLSDKLSKYLVYFLGTTLGIVMVAINCNLGITPLWLVILINALLFMAITSRMIASSALISSVPDLADRGAYMSINSAIQQLSGGIAASLAGAIVVQEPSGRLRHYDTLGYVVIAAMIITLILVYNIHVLIRKRNAAAGQPSAGGAGMTAKL